MSCCAAPPRPSHAVSAPAGRLARGRFLVANRSLSDPTFSETVVLLVDYDDNGALGVVVNRPTDVPLDAALPEVEELRKRKDIVFLGGPVARDRMVLLLRTTATPPQSVLVFDKVYATGSLKALRHTIGHGESMRAYAGYAGWGAGQLDAEVARGDWLIGPADSKAIFDDPPERSLVALPRTLLRRLGRAAGCARAPALATRSLQCRRAVRAPRRRSRPFAGRVPRRRRCAVLQGRERRSVAEILLRNLSPSLRAICVRIRYDGSRLARLDDSENRPRSAAVTAPVGVADRGVVQRACAVGNDDVRSGAAALLRASALPPVARLPAQPGAAPMGRAAEAAPRRAGIDSAAPRVARVDGARPDRRRRRTPLAHPRVAAGRDRLRGISDCRARQHGSRAFSRT